MKQQEFKRRLKTYIENNLSLDAKINKLLLSGCIDLDNKEDNWIIEKAAAYAIFTAIADDFKPLHSETMKEARNIQKFI